MNNNVCSKELSLELFKAGYKQEGIWWWDLIRKKEDCDIGDKPEDEWALSYEECYHGDKDDLIVAPTIVELANLLPCRIMEETEEDSDNGMLEIFRTVNSDVWAVKYLNKYLVSDVELAEAMGKMVLYLLKEGKIK